MTKSRESFDRDLQNLETSLLAMASEVSENVEKVTDALVRRDVIVARQMMAADIRMNQQTIDTAQECFRLIARQQPMAGDMRFIGSVLAVVGELERIHDYVKGIGKIIERLGETKPPRFYNEKVKRMADVAYHMLVQSMDAFTYRDAALARSIVPQDNRVDELFNELYAEIIAYVIQDASRIASANLLEWAMHNLERAADRATNICEWVVYMVEGQYVKLDSEYQAPPISADD